MSHSIRRSLVALSLVYSLGFDLAETAFAAKSPARSSMNVRPLAQTLSGAAKASYDSAKLLFDTGDFEGALVKFRAAYEMQGDPRLLWNMAACERSLRHYTKVRVLAEEYLARGEATALIGAEDRQGAQDLLRSLTAVIGHAFVVIKPQGSSLTIDGSAVDVSSVESKGVALDVGSHTFAVSHPGFRSQTITKEIEGGQRPVKFEVTLEPEAAELTVKTSVDSAVITVDGTVKGNATWGGQLSPGHRLLRVTADGYQPYELDLSLTDRERREVSVNLTQLPTSRTALWVLASSAVVVGAAVGGYFLFRPNEAPLVTGNVGVGVIRLPLTSGDRP